MTGTAEGGVLFLGAADVTQALPDVAARLELAARAMSALVEDAELPPKIAVHPRATESFAHAMPAFVRGDAADGSADLLGLKWVSGFPPNATRGLPAIFATILLSNPLTGRVEAVLDGGVITAHRTAAVSGVAIRSWLAERPSAAPAVEALRVAIVGAGVQAHSHLSVLGHLLPGSNLVIADRHVSRADQLAIEARSARAFGSVSVAGSATDAVRGAQVVLTMVSFGADRQGVPASAFEAAHLVIAVDYDMCVPAGVAQEAASGGRFLVDERGQFLANRAAGIFAGYPDPVATLGEWLLGRGAAIGGGARSDGPTVVTHLGVGVADLVFADAVVRAAEREGLGAVVGRAAP